MRPSPLLLLLALAPPAGAVDLLDRVELQAKPVGRYFNGREVYTTVATLKAATYFAVPMQYIPPAGGGGGSSAIISGTTTITSGTDKAVGFNDGGVANFGDANITWDKTADAQRLNLKGGTASGKLCLYEASGSGTDSGCLATTALSADRIWTMPNASTTVVGLSVSAQNFSQQVQFSGGTSVNTTSTNQQIISKTVTLTEAGGAEVVFTATNATTNTFGMEFSYRVTATDGTNRASREGTLKLVCDNAAGTMTCTKGATAETDDESVLIATGGATLTYAIATDVATANAAKITFNIDSSLVVTVASITWTAICNGICGTIS